MMGFGKETPFDVGDFCFFLVSLSLFSSNKFWCWPWQLALRVFILCVLFDVASPYHLMLCSENRVGR